MKTNHLLLALAATIAGLTGCSSTPITASSILETSYPIELGNEKNVLADRGKVFFLGHRVERFRLKARFVDPDGRTGPWVPGVTVSFAANGAVEQFGQLPPDAEPDGSFWTREITGNSVRIQLSTAGQLADFLGGRPRLEIVAVDRQFLADSAPDDVPISAPAPSGGSLNTAPVMALDDEVIGFSPGLGEAQHYRILLPGSEPRLESLYISPRFFGFGLDNDVGLKVHISPTGFVSPTADVQWIEPAPGDSGIYTEFENVPGQALSVTVVSTLPVPYLIRDTRMVERFSSLVLERDELMANAPDIDVDGIRDGAGPDAPFNAQIADYLQPSATYDRRIREALVIGSAYALDGSDGQMRFLSAELHRDTDPFRDVDVHFAICDDLGDPACRANAGPFHIDMFTGDLRDPVGAGWTLHHEWGHFEYGLPDEYIDISGPPPLFADAIDPNSLMGTRSSTEFCTPFNHFWAEDAGGEEDSAWTQIADQYDVSPAPTTFAELSQGRYLDVLHKLDSLLDVTVD